MSFFDHSWLWCIVHWWLWLTMIDHGWLWMTMGHYGRAWLTRVDKRLRLYQSWCRLVTFIKAYVALWHSSKMMSHCDIQQSWHHIARFIKNDVALRQSSKLTLMNVLIWYIYQSWHTSRLWIVALKSYVTMQCWSKLNYYITHTLH